MRKMQGAEHEGEGSVLTYVTEPEFLKQHSSLRVMTHRPRLFYDRLCQFATSDESA